MTHDTKRVRYPRATNLVIGLGVIGLAIATIGASGLSSIRSLSSHLDAASTASTALDGVRAVMVRANAFLDNGTEQAQRVGRSERKP